MKIGRNQTCPCRSGKKYKHCCLPLRKAGLPPRVARPARVSLAGEVGRLQAIASRGQAAVWQTGVFVFFGMPNGDAWVLEATECDAFQAAADGRPLPPPVNEEQGTIEVDWSHSFALLEDGLALTSHVDGQKTMLEGAPIQQIGSAVRRIARQCSDELRRQIHLRPDQAPTAFS